MATTNSATVERQQVAESARCLSEAAGRLGDAIEAEGDSGTCGKFGVIFTAIDEPHFRPKNAQSLPPLIAERLPYHLARQLAVGLNQETIDSRKGVWHFAVRGRSGWSGVLRVQFAPHRLPQHPASTRSIFD